MKETFTIGLDYGTNSVRALVVACTDGRELATYVAPYGSGRDGVILDERDHNLARQHPGDYVEGLRVAVAGALAEAEKEESFRREQVIGVGVDATGSSPIPVDGQNRALAEQAAFRGNPNAQCWLWKDHTSWQEAEWITEKARELRPHYLAKIGGVYSSEWFWAKIWHCLRVDPEVFAAAHSWVELADYVPALLAGVADPAQVRRGVCMAGHKALYAEDWGGLPDAAFLGALDPQLAALRPRLYEKAYPVGEPAGRLSASWAAELGLPEGIAVAMGEMDVHYGAIGSGIREGVVVKAIGTSSCDTAVVSNEKPVADIPGICGIVDGAILPGYYGIEAGQSAVGDIFNWWVETVCEGDAKLHGKLTAEAERLRPGESGLVALDWNNGNRTLLVDPQLSGLLVGQTLHTSRAEIYRALIEATAFGTRCIFERLADYGVAVQTVICCGGIAEKNPLLMQIYADVTGCTLLVSRSGQSCALGAALGAAVAAGPEAGGYGDFASAQEKMTGLKEFRYEPRAKERAVYDRLYGLYRKLHDAFGVEGASVELGHLMKELLAIKDEARSG